MAQRSGLLSAILFLLAIFFSDISPSFAASKNLEIYIRQINPGGPSFLASCPKDERPCVRVLQIPLKNSRKILDVALVIQSKGLHLLFQEKGTYVSTDEEELDSFYEPLSNPELEHKIVHIYSPKPIANKADKYPKSAVQHALNKPLADLEISVKILP